MRRLVLVVALVCAAAPLASAQPMMIDPSRMSGIPRPDSQVPAGTITVRLIRGELSNRVVGHEVQLVDQPSGKALTQKTDENGRATFGGLSGGPFVARAVDGDDTFDSQPIELPGDMGVRVMLVFKQNGAGAPDGVGRPDKTVPPGTVVVRAVGLDGGILPGLDVVLGQARAGDKQVVERKGKTDDKGEARFSGLDSKPDTGYLAEVRKDGTRYAGKPFRLSDNMGALVVVQVAPVTKDLSSLTIGPGSHLIVEITDDAVQVVEVWRLQNSGTSAVDVPGGLHLPLPEKALQATQGPDSPPNFTVSGHEAVWRGPIPPGDTQLQLMFVLAYQGDSLVLTQKTPIAFSDTAVVTENIAGFDVQGDRLEREERELGGRKLVLLRGPGTAPGGELHLTLVGLPHGDPTWRYVAAAVTLVLLAGFGLYASRGGGGVSDARRKLEARREKLLDELVALEQKPDSAGRAKKRDELTDKLAQLYRDLDNVA